MPASEQARLYQQYYATLFPVEEVHAFANRTFSSSSPCPPEKREYGVEHLDSVFKRWKECASPDSLRRLVSSAGVGKVNIGAVYEDAVSTRYKRSSSADPIAVRGRELIIDVDLTDYDRFSIDKDDVDENDRVFPVVGIAIELCKSVLQEAFGFTSFLAVYSGRRGAHLYVLDDRAFRLADDARRAIASFLTPPDRPFQPSRRGRFRWILNHPSFSPHSEFYLKMLDFFESTCLRRRSEGGLGLLDSWMAREDFLSTLECDFYFSGLQRSLVLARGTPGDDAFKMIKSVLSRIEDVPKREQAETRLHETVCTYVFPRIDANVTASAGHMLKCVYSLHPGTGRVSTPIFDSALDFDPRRDSISASDLLDPTSDARERFDANLAAFRSTVLLPPPPPPSLPSLPRCVPKRKRAAEAALSNEPDAPREGGTA